MAFNGAKTVQHFTRPTKSYTESFTAFNQENGTIRSFTILTNLILLRGPFDLYVFYHFYHS